MKVRIANKEFIVKVATSDAEKATGLSNVKKLKKGHGLLMKFDEAMDVPITMENMSFPLDLIFIRDNKVIGKTRASVGEANITIGSPSDYVLEINAGESTGIRKGNKVDFIGEKKEDGTVEMADGGLTPDGIRHLLDEKGQIQMNLLGGERVFSRISTKRMFELAKQKKYKTLGRFLYKEIKAQEKRPIQYADN